MADVKFSELTSLSAAASADVLAIVDSSESASKQLSIDNLFGAVPVNLAVTDLTQSTSNTTGSITTTGGVGVTKDVYIGGVLNVFGNTNISGANTNITAGTVDIDANVVIYNSITVNSTSTMIGKGGINRPLYFRDTGLGLDTPTNGTLDLFADTIFDITAPTMNVISTTVDFDANVVIHSTLTVNSTTALIGTTLPLHFRDTGLSLSSPTNGTLDIAADTILEITAPTTNVIATTALTIHTPAISANGTVTIGADDTGYDVMFFGATSGNYMLWDEDADSLLISGDVDMVTNGNRIDLDTDNDTSIRASADDTITIEVGGNDLIALTTTSTFSCPVTVGVDGTGKDVTFYGDTASSQMLWDTSDDKM